MSDMEQIIGDLTATLMDQRVEKIILFGSFAKGNPTADSDLDIMVVTSDSFIPSTNRQKMELHHQYNQKIKKFRGIIPIDLMLYTRLMFQQFQESGSIISNEITRKGRVLYEATHARLA